MKAGDMVLQSELVARWADGKRLAFIGDGDAISVCVAYLHARGIISSGPSHITLFDFDERICSALTRFADRERLTNLDAKLYNCLDAFPGPNDFDCFYTNPPWGASNGGESIAVFMERGFEAIAYNGEGMVVIADDPELDWAKRVLSRIQGFGIANGFFVQKMASRMHSYHLDDAPELRSCNLLFKSVSSTNEIRKSEPISDPQRLSNFYGMEQSPRVQYVREIKRLDYGKAHEDEYTLELRESNNV
jgi:predicted methyltransferase